MLSQAQPFPLTEENLKKHQRETARNQAALKKTIAKQTSLRSAGDGESTDFVCDETILKASLDGQKGNEQQTFSAEPGKQPSDSTANPVLEDMSEHKKSDTLYSSSRGKTSSNSNQPIRRENDSSQSLEDEKNIKLPGKEKDHADYEANSDNPDDSNREDIEDNEDSVDDSDSSSSVDSDSDFTVAKDAKSDEENDNSNEDDANSSRSSSPLVDDNDDDDDDDDDDDTEEEEQMEEDEKSDGELTHYSSSLNASVSSIPTLCNDSPEPNSSDELPEENQEENVGQIQEEAEKNGEESEVADEKRNINEDEEVKLEEEEPVENPQTMSDQEEENFTPPGSRQVSGRSATPLTVVVSEFDDVESTIFDRRVLSAAYSTSQDKLTPSENSGHSDVTIKNWPGLGQGFVSSKVESAQGEADRKMNTKDNKQLKTRRERNARKPNLVKKISSTTRESKKQPLSRRITNKNKSDNVNSKKAKFVRQISLSSNNSDTISVRNPEKKRVARNKKRPGKQVSFDNTQTENVIKTNTSDSAFFGSRTESRGEEEQASPRPPESEHSGRTSSRWSAVETERCSSSGTGPISTVQSPRSFFSSRQTTLVEQVTAVNQAPMIQGKKKQLPSLRVNTHAPAKPKSKKSHSATSKMTTKTTGESSMMRRVLSANRNKVSRLHNILEELQQEVEELKSENKSLKRVSHRQDKEIRKIEDEESSLPMLLQRHSAEMRTLKERLRKKQDMLHQKERESQERDHEIQKLRDKVKSYRELSQDRKLEERAALAKKLENIQNEMALKDKKIEDLEKGITLKDKARQREMKEQKERHRKAKEELQRVQEDFRSLRERLQEKERELDEKNIYHYHITKQKKKGTTLPALPAASQAPALTAPVVTHAEKTRDATEKRANVFLTNAPSDSGSVVTDEGERSFRADVRQEKLSVPEASKPVVLEADRRDSEEEGRLQKEGEERRRLEEEERRRRIEVEERKRREEGEKRREEEEKRRAEEERRRKEEEDRLNKQREEEEERARKEKQEEERKHFEEDEEIRRKKDLLLARMRAIDAGNDKPSNVITEESSVDGKPKKLPIFLQSEKSEPQQTKPAKSLASDDDIFSDAGGDRKKHSSARSKQSGYSYEFKQTVENLHHGLPAHASQESVKNESIKADAKDSLSDDLSFGSYKPTLGRRAAAKRDKEDLSSGGYNPSFGAKKETTRKNSGLDFGAGKKSTPEKEQNGVVFGDYKPTFGGASSKPTSTQQNGDIFGNKNSRRPRGFASKGASVFGDDLLTNDETIPTGKPLFGGSTFNKDKSSYPWENKVNVTRKASEEDSLLPRRKQLQSFGKSTEQNVRAVDNALDDVDDDIEEVIL